MKLTIFLLILFLTGCTCTDDSLIKKRYIPMLQNYIEKDAKIDSDMKEIHNYALEVWLSGRANP